MDYDKTREVLAALEREGVRYVIIGAVALNLQGLARATEDLDILVEPEAGNIDHLRK
jgi:predicted nucleotidyltransferase